MSQKQEELLKSQLNVEGVHKEDSSNERLVEHKQIKNTPFVMVRYEDKYFMVLGSAKLTDEYSSEEEVLEVLEERKWEILIACMLYLMDEYKSGEYQTWLAEQENKMAEKN